MGRMIDLIKQSAIPANMMRSAAKGALSVAPGEMVEILVYLAEHPLFGAEAKLTLAGWDQKVAKHVAADPKTSPEVLSYFIAADNLSAGTSGDFAGQPFRTGRRRSYGSPCAHRTGCWRICSGIRACSPVNRRCTPYR